MFHRVEGVFSYSYCPHGCNGFWSSPHPSKRSDGYGCERQNPTENAKEIRKYSLLVDVDAECALTYLLFLRVFLTSVCQFRLTDGNGPSSSDGRDRRKQALRRAEVYDDAERLLSILKRRNDERDQQGRNVRIALGTLGIAAVGTYFQAMGGITDQHSFYDFQSGTNTPTL